MVNMYPLVVGNETFRCSLVVPNPDHTITSSTRKFPLVLLPLLALTCLTLLSWLLLLRLTTRVGQASGRHGGGPGYGVDADGVGGEGIDVG